MKTGNLQAQQDNEVVPAYVWENPVRLAHWLIALALVLLGVTGIRLHESFGLSQISSIGTMRAVHELSGLLLVSALLLRFYWFWAGNEWARLPAFLPLTREKWRNIQAMLRYHIIGGRPPLVAAGHNPLAACAYLAVYALLVVQCLTGVALLSLVADSALLSTLAGWIPRVLGPSYVHVTHYRLMFVFMAFTMGHICAIVLFARHARNGLITSMVTGWKLIPKKLLNDEGASSHSARVSKSKNGGGPQPIPPSNINHFRVSRGDGPEIPQPVRKRRSSKDVLPTFSMAGCKQRQDLVSSPEGED